MKPQDKILLDETDPSYFLFEKINGFLELFSFLKLVKEEHSDKEHIGLRVMPNTGDTVENSLINTLNSFPEFFINKLLPYLHYFHNRGSLVEDKNSIILVLVFYDFIAKYEVNLKDMDMDSPVNLKIFTKTSIESIKNIEAVLILSEEISQVSFNKPTFNRESILKEVVC